MEFCKKRETARENRETYFDSVKSKFKEKKKRNNRVSIAWRKKKRHLFGNVLEDMTSSSARKQQYPRWKHLARCAPVFYVHQVHSGLE